MGTSVLDGRPTPASDIHRFLNASLAVRCTSCTRAGDLPIAGLVRFMRIPPRTPIYRVAERLRCLACGGRGRVTGVVGWRR